MIPNCFGRLHNFWNNRVTTLGLLTACALSWASVPARAATFVVENLNDSGSGSLRAAMEAAKTAGDDNIPFAPGVKGTINLLTALPVLNSNVTIAGPGAGLLTVRRAAGVATPNFRIFEVVTGGIVEISGLTITNGSPLPDGDGSEQMRGGGIRNSGNLKISYCVVSGNKADDGGGIRNDPNGTLSLDHCSIANNLSGRGGGITNDGTGRLTVNSCLFVGNDAATSFGGGLFNQGDMALSNSTFYGNRATDAGGFATFDGVATAANCTVVGNQAVGGPGQFGGGGGIAAYDGDFTLGNSLVANNTDIIGGPDCEGSFTSGDYNLIRNTAGFLLTGPTTHNIYNVDPLLDRLRDNGGPTLTLALLSGSPAINKGSTDLTLDQRGAARPQGAQDDIGAFEGQVANSKPQNVRLEAIGLTPGGNVSDPVGKARLFRATYGDANGYQNIRYAYLQIKTGQSNVLRLAYDLPNNKLYILGDNGQFAGGFKPGTKRTLTSSQGAISCQQTRVRALNSTQMQVDWVIAAGTPLAGATHPVLLYVTDKGSLSDGFDQGATWTITSAP